MLPTYLVLHGGSLDLGCPIQAVLSCRTPHRGVEVATVHNLVFAPRYYGWQKFSSRPPPQSWVGCEDFAYFRKYALVQGNPSRRLDTSWWYSNQQRYRPRLAQIRSDSYTRLVFSFHHLFFSLLVHIIALRGWSSSRPDALLGMVRVARAIIYHGNNLWNFYPKTWQPGC